MKRCKKCNQDKELEEFHKNHKSKDGHISTCKVCISIWHKQRDRTEVNLKNKLFYEANKVRYYKKYYQDNKEIINKKRVKYVADKRATNPLFKFNDNLRSLIRSTLKRRNIRKKSKTVEILGCSISEFRYYIEGKFEPWMNWGNQGNPKDGILEINKTWDLDHIIPISSAKSEEELIKLNHYTNFQPMCSYTNRYIKSNNT